MRWSLGLLFVLMFLLLIVVPTSAQDDGTITVNCDTGVSFSNGTEFVVVQMRPGFSYTATAIGLNGFDPILAVLDDTGRGLCVDDSSEAADFGVNLPTTGRVNASDTSSQIVFSQTRSEMANVSLVVGGYNSEPGEFVLLLEGMAATTADGVGDPFQVRLSDPLVNSGVALSTYMIGVVDSVDPHMFIADSNMDPFVDGGGQAVQCDDAGTNSCWGESTNLRGSVVSRTRGRESRTDNLDAMLSLPLSDFAGMDFSEGSYLTYVMTRATQGTGDYVIAFHAATGGDGQAAVVEAPTPEPTVSRGSQWDSKTDPATSGNPDLVGGVTVTCEDGGEFTNGVEFTVIQMRSGFTYTATAIGIGDFDPILAVLDEDRRGLCNDDSEDAARFFADLPSTGLVNGNGRSAQVSFSQTASVMADVSIVVGGYDNIPGEFILILEGMAATDFDGVGDPFAVQITPGLAGSDVPLSVYMIGVSGSVDPLFYLTAPGTFDPYVDPDGLEVGCDDAGNESVCWGESASLAGSSVARTSGRFSDADETDAMLSIPMSDFADLDFSQGPYYVTFVMTRYEGTPSGDYVIAFHGEAR